MKSKSSPVRHGGKLPRRDKTFSRHTRIFLVPRSMVRIPFMIPVLLAAALVMLALATQAGVMVFQHRFPAQGKPIEVSGATPNVLDIGPKIGPKDAVGPPIVLIHGASSNLETMRRPLGDRLAADHRVILIDRPGHGWSSAAGEETSTPAAQARMIEEAFKKLGVGPVVLVVHS